MPLSSATIAFDLSDHLGADFDARRTKAWVTTNIPNETVIDTDGNKIRLGSGNVTINTDGTGSFTTWTPGVDSNPASWQTYLHVDYPDRHAAKGRKTRTFGPFTITASADLADLVPQQEVAPEYVSALVALLEQYATEARTYRDEANARTVTDLGTSDGQVSTLLATPGSQSRAAHLQVLTDEFLPLVVMGAI